MNLFQKLLDAVKPKYSAVVEGEKVRIIHESGVTDSIQDVGPGATHAIMQGNDMYSVFYQQGGVKTYRRRGGIVSFNGVCK